MTYLKIYKNSTFPDIIWKCGNFKDFRISHFSSKVLHGGRMFAKTGNNHGLKNLCWIEGRCVHGTQKRVRSYLQPFSDTSQKFPKYPEQYFYKIPLLLSELSSCLFTQVFRTFSRMFWYSPLVGLMRKSIMIRKPSTPFEKIQPFSQTFEYHGRDWLKS